RACARPTVLCAPAGQPARIDGQTGEDRNRRPDGVPLLRRLQGGRTGHAGEDTGNSQTTEGGSPPVSVPDSVHVTAIEKAVLTTVRDTSRKVIQNDRAHHR